MQDICHTFLNIIVIFIGNIITIIIIIIVVLHCMIINVISMHITNVIIINFTISFIIMALGSPVLILLVRLLPIFSVGFVCGPRTEAVRVLVVGFKRLLGLCDFSVSRTRFTPCLLVVVVVVGWFLSIGSSGYVMLLGLHFQARSCGPPLCRA